VRALLGAYRSQPAQKTAQAYHAYLDEAESVFRRIGGRPPGRFESALRDRIGRHARSSTIWRVPPKARRALEHRGLVYRTPELVWSDSGWVVNNEYFV
jgi:hypothetical protein